MRSCSPCSTVQLHNLQQLPQLSKKLHSDKLGSIYHKVKDTYGRYKSQLRGKQTPIACKAYKTRLRRWSYTMCPWDTTSKLKLQQQKRFPEDMDRTLRGKYRD